MDLTRRADHERKILIVTAGGSADLEASQVAMREVAGDPLLAAGYDLLLDFRGGDYLPSAADGRRLGRTGAVPEVLGANRTAIVVSGEAAFGMANLIAAHAGFGGARVRAFRDPDAAVDWLLADR